MNLKINHIAGNDLVVNFDCVCNNPKYKGTSIENLMKTRISLYGYNDSNFFYNVNSIPRKFSCSECKKEYTEQWFDDGYVMIKEKDDQ